MCRFITAVLPNDADIEKCAEVLRVHRRACAAYVNPVLAAQIGDQKSSYCTTVGHCDCDSPLGSANFRDSAGRGKAPEAAAARMRGKGWSDAKIARALGQRSEADSRPRSPLRGGREETSLDEWCALIRDILALRGVASIGLLIHQYGGGIHDEVVDLQTREVVRACDLNEATLAAMRSDTIYEFRR